MNILSTLPENAKEKLLACLAQDNFKAAREIYETWLNYISRRSHKLTDVNFNQEENPFSQQ